MKPKKEEADRATRGTGAIGMGMRAILGPLPFVCGLALSLLPWHASAADKVDEALARASEFLLSQQDAKTGSVSLKGRNETAMTSLTILALASLGHQPADQTPEGNVMRKALAFVLRPELQQKDG